jgi:hypothetical protein
MTTIHRFRPKPQRSGIAGYFFWGMSRSEQIARIRELMRQQLSTEQISTIVREPCSTVRALAGVRQ